MEIRQKLVDRSKWSIKCPYLMTPEFIVVHNTANDASAENEIAYMIRNNNHTSFHFAVDDQEVVQGIPLDRNAWHAGDGQQGHGNRKGIAIEICWSKSGGPKFEQAEKNAAELIAQLLEERKWGTDRVKKHHDFANKNCPHRTIAMGWDRFIKMIEDRMTTPKVQAKPAVTVAGALEPLTGYVEIVYRGADGVDYHSCPTFEGHVAGTAHKGAVFSVIGKIKVNNRIMYKLKSGVYITGAKQYVSFRKTLHKEKAPDAELLKAGTKIMIKQTAEKYATGQEIKDYYKGVRYTIQQVSSDKTKVLVQELYSWVWANDITIL